MKNLEQREGFINSHLEGLPKETTIMNVVKNDVDGERIYLCEWKPFDINQYSDRKMPSEGYLGTVSVIEGRYEGIGFHAWQQNDSEFIWYYVV